MSTRRLNSSHQCLGLVKSFAECVISLGCGQSADWISDFVVADQNAIESAASCHLGALLLPGDLLLFELLASFVMKTWTRGTIQAPVVRNPQTRTVLSTFDVDHASVVTKLLSKNFVVTVVTSPLCRNFGRLAEAATSLDGGQIAHWINDFVVTNQNAVECATRCHLVALMLLNVLISELLASFMMETRVRVLDQAIGSRDPEALTLTATFDLDDTGVIAQLLCKKFVRLGRRTITALQDRGRRCTSKQCEEEARVAHHAFLSN